MNFTFYKYQGTGNDFVMIDNRTGAFKPEKSKIAALCHRRFGIGADGLILLENDENADFKMVYFNADGAQSTMCGNGGRCIAKFAQHKGIINKKATFMAIDGLHEATIDADGTVNLKMTNAAIPVEKNNGFFVDTGSPHHIEKVENAETIDVQNQGEKLRNKYGNEGSNINFVEVQNDKLIVRTYERGVEAETLSCGTGVTASAIVAHAKGWVSKPSVGINSPGGNLHVSFDKSGDGYNNIWLSGPANFVFQGEINY